jgi:two-component system LytT family response regulator
MRALFSRVEEESWPQAVRALVVDADPESRSKIKEFLRPRTEIHVMAECRTAVEAEAAAGAQPFDLVFASIELPDGDGLELAKRIAGLSSPVVVLLGGHREQALRAFDAHPADYLLKPLNRERFLRAVDHALKQVETRREAERSTEKAGVLSGWGERIAIKSDHRILILRTSEIEWIEAAGNYVNIHAKHGTHFVRETMNSIEGKMPPARFMRIHRSTIVNLDRVKELKAGINGEYLVLMQDGQALTLSRGYRSQLQRLLR